MFHLAIILNHVETTVNICIVTIENIYNVTEQISDKWSDFDSAIIHHNKDLKDITATKVMINCYNSKRMVPKTYRALHQKSATTAPKINPQTAKHCPITA